MVYIPLMDNIFMLFAVVGVVGQYLYQVSTPWDYPKVATQEIDRILYDNGAYCPERWD